jgi:hypothetical protein
MAIKAARFFVLAGILFFACNGSACASNSTLLSHLKPDHPRLLISAGQAAAVMADLKDDAEKKKAFEALQEKGKAMLALPAVQYRKGDLLEVSRTVLKRVLVLAFLYRAEGDHAYLQRAKAEMLAAAAFPDWHPEHFLDTAEMMDALAIGYDWLYDSLTPAERRTISSAIVEKGLRVAGDAYDHDRYFWTHDNTTNWNTVCNGSILMASLALAEPTGSDASEVAATSALARSMAEKSFVHFKQGLAHYAPDGAIDEGPTYWHYATAYAIRTIACLESACGEDFDLCSLPGLSNTGDFALAMIGPTGKLFNFADSGPTLDSAPELFWLARHFNRPTCAWKQRHLLNQDRTNVSVFDLIWWNNPGTEAGLAGMPLVRKFESSAPFVTMRSSWSDPLASFVAIMAGYNASHHTHLGMGNFVYDWGGVRWVSLLGPDNYDLPGYFDVAQGNESPRWRYYRNNSQGQNVITFAGRDQDCNGRGVILESQLDDAKYTNYVILDLSSGYRSSHLARMRRGICLFRESGSLLVQDEYTKVDETKQVTGTQSRLTPTIWQFHTPARITILAPRHAVLAKGDMKLDVFLLSPVDTEFSKETLSLAAPQNKVSGIEKLSIRLNDKDVLPAAGARRISVLFTPASVSDTVKTPLDMVPLDDWKRTFAQNGDNILR